MKPGLSLASVIFAMVKRRLGHVPRPVRVHALNPASLRGYALMESAQESGRGVPVALRKLAQVRTASRIGCPF